MSKEEYKDAIEVSVIFHEGQRMFAVPKQPTPVQQEPVAWRWVNSKGWLTYGEIQHDTFVSTPLYTSPQPTPVQQEPWGFHIQFNNGKDATFKGLDYLAECEAHLEAGETITTLYIKENT